jgi:hypothetical protein
MSRINAPTFEKLNAVKLEFEARKRLTEGNANARAFVDAKKLARSLGVWRAIIADYESALAAEEAGAKADV